MMKTVLAASLLASVAGQAIDADGVWHLDEAYHFDCLNNAVQIDLATLTFMADGAGLNMTGAFLTEAPLTLAMASYTPPQRVIVSFADDSNDLCTAVATLASPNPFVPGDTTSFSLSVDFTGACVAGGCSSFTDVDLGTAQFLATGTTFAPTTGAPSQAPTTSAPTTFVYPVVGDYILYPSYEYSCSSLLGSVNVDAAGMSVTSTDGEALVMVTIPEDASNEEYTFTGTIDAEGKLAVELDVADIDPDLAAYCSGAVTFNGQERPWPRVGGVAGIIDLDIKIDLEGVCSSVCDSGTTKGMLSKCADPPCDILTFAPTTAPTTSAPSKRSKVKTMSGAPRAALAPLAAFAMLMAAVLRN